MPGGKRREGKVQRTRHIEILGTKRKVWKKNQVEGVAVKKR